MQSAGPVREEWQPIHMSYLYQGSEFGHWKVSGGPDAFAFRHPSLAQTDVRQLLDSEAHHHKVCPIGTGRLIALVGVSSTENATTGMLSVMFGLVLGITPRTSKNKNELPAARIHRQCNPKTLEVAFLTEPATEFFAVAQLQVLQERYLACGQGLSHAVPTTAANTTFLLRDMWMFGITKSTSELTAVAQTPECRYHLGLGINNVQVAVNGMDGDKRSHLLSLCGQLLKLVLTPCHIETEASQWIRTTAVSYAAEMDGHVLGTLCAVTMALLTNRLDLCIQGLFGAGKSKSMAILILALLELDVDHRLRILFLCKENSGTRSFADLLQWLDPPVAVLRRLGRLVGDQERNKASYSYTKFDINPRERRQMLAQCQLVMATGGTVSQDLTMQWSTMGSFMQDLSLMIIDEGQQLINAINTVLPGLPAQFRTATPQEVAQLPRIVDPQLLEGATVNFSRSMIRLAWLLQHVETLLPMAGEIQAELNCHTAGVSDAHAWGLMLPSSSRVSPVTYHSVVAVRYPDLCREINHLWELGSFASGGIPDRPPGFQFVLWDTEAKINGLVAADLNTLVAHVIRDLQDSTNFSDGLFVMTTATDHKNNLNRSTIKKNFSRALRVETIANSAGGTAAVAIVAQPSTGFLNGHFYADGSPTEDTEDCLGRITVGLTRSKSLTIVVSPLDMIGLIGMAQVLATLAYGIKGLRRGTSTWDWPYFHNDPQQENASQMERWSLNQAPTWTVPPLAIANRYYDTNNQLVQNTRYRLILTKASNLDWLIRDKHAMRDLSTVAQEGSHHWVPMQDLPFNEVILFGYAADHSSRPTYVCLPSGLYHARSGRVLQQSGPNQEVTPLPGIYFFDGWRVRPCMKIPTDLPQSRDPPERDVQRPAATATTTESSQTPHEEARDILAKALRNQAEDGPSTRRAAIRAYKYLYALVQQHGPQLQKVYEASKEHATRSKGNDESLKYRAQPQELPTVPRQLTSELLHCLSTLPDPWPLAKITINLDTASQWVSKMGRLFFADRYVQHPGDPNSTVPTPEIQNALNTVKDVLADLELRVIEFFSDWLVALLMPARHVLETRSPHFSFMLLKDYWFKELYLGLKVAASLDRTESRRTSAMHHGSV